MIAIGRGRKLKNKAASTSTAVKSESSASSSTVDSVNPEGADVTDLFKFESSDVKIVSKNSRGNIKVDVEFEFNIVKAIRNGVSSVAISFEKSLQDLTSASEGLITISPEAILDRILTDSSLTERRALEAREKVIKTSYADVSSAIDNSIATTLAKIDAVEAADLLGTRKAVKMMTPRALGQVASQVPVLQTPVENASAAKRRRDVTPKQLMGDLILKDGRPPAIASQTRNTFNDPDQTLSGVSTKVKPMDGRHRDLVGVLLDGPVKDVVVHRGNKSSVRPIAVTVDEPIEFKTIKKTVRLSRKEQDALGNNAIIAITALDSGGVVIAREAVEVDIVTKLTIATYDERPPVENASGTGVTVPPIKSVGIEDDEPDVKTDLVEQEAPLTPPRGGGVGQPPVPELFVNTISPILPFDDGGWQNLGESRNITPGETIGPKTRLGIGRGKPTVVGLGSRGFSPTPPSFASFIVPAPTRHLATASSFYGQSACAETDNKFLALSTFLGQGAINLTVVNFQSAYSVGIVRKDCTLKERTFTAIDVAEPIQVVSEESLPITFTDVNVKPNHVYEYRAKIYTKTGREIISTGFSTIKYQKLNDNIASITISKPVMTVDAQGELDVQFKITTTINDSSISAVTELLQSNNLDTYFSDDIETNRENLKNLIVLGIERVDLTRGVTEDFGIFTGTTFSDKANRTLANVSLLRANRDYRYVVTVFLRDSETLLPTTFRTVVDENTLNSYQFRPAKYLHPSTLADSTLRSDRTIAKVDVNDEFKAGFSGAQKFVDVTTRTGKATISGGSCKVNELGHVNLRWKVKGDTRQIDHFVIVGETAGMRSIVGRSHPFSPNRTFRFEDRTLSKSVGETTYSVCPVYTDLTLGKEIPLGKVMTKKGKRRK